SYRKDTLRKLLRRGSTAIAGPSTISFDPIARQRIFAAIDSASFKKRTLLKEAYDSLKRRVGRVPKMVDFLALGAMSPLHFLSYAQTYPHFKAIVDPDSGPPLGEEYQRSLSFFSVVVARGIRIQEIAILERVMVTTDPVSLEDIAQHCKKAYGFVPSQRSVQSALNILDNGFFKRAMRSKFSNISYLHRDGTMIRSSDEFRHLLEDPHYREELADVLNVGRYHYRSEFYEGRDEDDLVLYQKYSRRDACMLLGWENSCEGTMYGYQVNRTLKVCPIFVTYHKDSERIEPQNDYRDRFLTPSQLIWESKPKRRMTSKDIVSIRDSSIRKLLFVKKSDAEGDQHYYLGEIVFEKNAPSTKEYKKGGRVPIVMMRFSLSAPLPEDLYHYLIEEPEVLDETIEPA
ncbi:MAG: DUF3427 domain-containing protein, partial [Sphaerochaeta sp.]|nr:DUF3427 domain-containing protein [Sphaerochaeta sp.]